MTTKVFIVDDHYMVIEGIRSLLQNVAHIEWLGHAMNAASCLAFLQRQLPHVILMDINLPDKSGIELCKEVKEKYPQLYILGLSTFNQQSFIEKMITNGASGYILKNATVEELVEGITLAAQGKQYLSLDAEQVMRKPDWKDGFPLITRREKEVLTLIADGLTNTEIADKIFVSTTTVDSHRKNLLAKFEAKNTASLIKMAVQAGLI